MYVSIRDGGKVYIANAPIWGFKKMTLWVRQDSGEWLQTYIRPLGAESGVVQVENVSNGEEVFLRQGQQVEFNRPAGAGQ